ncbi:MAG: hypothetical protein U1D06_12245, partial [Paracoccaceae bacterium]|nr:hypothetical protein [Paracoccaceae bacterium]
AAVAALPDAAIPATLAQGYAIQQALVIGLVRDIVGWKLALVSAAAQAANGLNAPTVGPLLRGMVVESGARFARTCFRQPEIEPEIALILAQDLRGPADAATVRAATGAVRLAMEIADTRFATKTVHGQPGIVADLNTAGALVLGPRIAADARGAKITVTLADGTQVQGFPPDNRPDPFAAVAFLSGFLAERGQWLRAGDVVTTGTCAAPSRTDPGPVACRFAGLGEVTAFIEN